MKLSDFTRTEVKTHTITYRNKVNGYLDVEVVWDSSKPDEWRVCLIDYDDAVGCVGVFPTEEKVFYFMDRFLVMAQDAYARKYAKYGDHPVIRANGDLLVMTIE